MCEICNVEISDNSGGQFTNHVKKFHGMSLEDYVIQFQFNGIPPRCTCGLCEERPVFKRGKFLSFALNHQHYSEREKRYVEKFGTPLCSECKGEVLFHRGIPNKFCSQKCVGKNVGFSLGETQANIREEVFKKYGVDNVSKLDAVRDKISKSHRARTYSKASQSTRQKISIAVKKRWLQNDYRFKMMNVEFSQEERARRSAWLKERNKVPEFREKWFRSCKNRLSKLHQRIRSEMNLDELGFISEQQILRYFVDELNEEKKVIVEIYGDYPHANPAKYKSDDLIRMAGQTYTALEKWEMDEIRKERLENEGYKVFVVWESDDLLFKKSQLNNLLSSNIE